LLPETVTIIGLYHAFLAVLLKDTGLTSVPENWSQKNFCVRVLQVTTQSFWEYFVHH